MSTFSVPETRKKAARAGFVPVLETSGIPYEGQQGGNGQRSYPWHGVQMWSGRRFPGQRVYLPLELKDTTLNLLTMLLKAQKTRFERQGETGCLLRKNRRQRVPKGGTPLGIGRPRSRRKALILWVSAVLSQSSPCRATKRAARSC